MLEHFASAVHAAGVNVSVWMKGGRSTSCSHSEHKYTGRRRRSHSITVFRVFMSTGRCDNKLRKDWEEKKSTWRTSSVEVEEMNPGNTNYWRGWTGVWQMKPNSQLCVKDEQEDDPTSFNDVVFYTDSVKHSQINLFSFKTSYRSNSPPAGCRTVYGCFYSSKWRKRSIHVYTHIKHG